MWGPRDRLANPGPPCQARGNQPAECSSGGAWRGIWAKSSPHALRGTLRIPQGSVVAYAGLVRVFKRGQPIPDIQIRNGSVTDGTTRGGERNDA